MMVHSRSNGANFLLNIGPTAQGGIPDYERTLLALLGKWISLYGEAVYAPKPVEYAAAQGKDCILKDGSSYYFFVHDLKCTGDQNVVVTLGGPCTKSIDGIPEKVTSCTWLDSGQQLDFVQDAERRMLAIKCTGFPYGTHTVVRVMKITTE